MREDVGLFGACAGDGEEGCVEGRGGGGALLGVEGVEEGRVHAFGRPFGGCSGCCNARGKKCKRREQTGLIGIYRDTTNGGFAMVRRVMIARVTFGCMV